MEIFSSNKDFTKMGRVAEFNSLYIYYLHTGLDTSASKRSIRRFVITEKDI